MFWVLTLASTISYAQLPDVSFSKNKWQLDKGVIINADVLTLQGDPQKYVKAVLTKKVDPVRDIYFVADVKLENIKVGKEAYARPKLKLYSIYGRIGAINLTEDLQDKWFTTGIRVKRFDTYKSPEVTLELSVQNAEGTLRVRNPRLSTTPPPSSYTFPFSTPITNGCTIAIDTRKGRPFNNDLLGANTHHVAAPFGYEDERAQELYRYIGLPSIRFPAGTVGNFYNWEKDAFYEDGWTKSYGLFSSAINRDFKFAFDDYAALTTTTKASSILMFNMIHDSKDKNVRRLKNRLDVGLDIPWIELGNENYFNGQNYGQVKDLDGYLKHSREVSKALKAVVPGLKTAVNIHHENIAGDPWAKRLAENKEYYDGVVIHPYIDPATFMFNAYSGKVMLSAYKKILNYFDEYEAVFGQKPLLLTEWAILSHELPPNFIQALGTADIFMAILQGADRGLVDQASIHIFFQSNPYHATSLFGWSWEKRAIVKTRLGVMYEMMINTFKNNILYEAVGQSAALEVGLPAINARAVKEGELIKVFAINKLPSESPLKIIIDGKAYKGEYTLESFSEPVLGRAPYAMKEKPWTTVKGKDAILLPGYSINVVTINPESIAPLDTGEEPEEPKGEGLGLKVFPNPVINTFEVENFNAKEAEIAIFDAKGKTLGTWKYTPKEKIDMSPFSSGMYHLKIRTQNDMFQHKISKW